MKPNRLLLSLLTAVLVFSPAGIIAQTTPAAAPAKKAEPAPTTTTATKPAESVEQATLTSAVKLESVEVLGSRIRRLDVEGPSPVSTYDRDYIRSTGAFSLADFMNTLPQNYTGISSGRGRLSGRNVLDHL
jgi:iron complex outermembrane receptor protein